jgi:hypothetical protein
VRDQSLLEFRFLNLSPQVARIQHKALDETVVGSASTKR